MTPPTMAPPTVAPPTVKGLTKIFSCQRSNIGQRGAQQSHVEVNFFSILSCFCCVNNSEALHNLTHRLLRFFFLFLVVFSLLVLPPPG